MSSEKHLPESLLKKQLHSDDALTVELRERGVKDFGQLLAYIRALPYGRNSERGDLSLVIKENKGTCSSKHACIKMLTDLNELAGIDLILCHYKMNAVNTPGIGHHIQDNNLSYIPEAHCYLKIENHKIDLTKANSDISRIEADILQEIKITPEQVGSFKAEYHQNFIKSWITKVKIAMDFETVWSIREKCIKELSKD